MAIVQVNPDGKAPKGLSANDVVKTAGGDYKITKVNPDGSYQSTKVTSGSSSSPSMPTLSRPSDRGQSETSLMREQRNQNSIQQPIVQQPPTQQTAPDYSYLIPLAQWFSGQNIANKNGTLDVGGFSFAPGSYETQGSNYYVDPMTMAGSYLNRAPRELTPDVYDNYVDQATEYYEPTYQARINALNDILAERKGATRRTAIGGGTYTSGNYLDRLNEEVEKPYAEGMTDLETNLAALVNQMAMQEFEKERAAEQAQNQNVANYLMNLSATGRDEAWKRALQSIMLAQGGGAYNA